MKLYQFAKISARCFPNMTDLNNPWIFPKDVAIVVNVSQRFDAAIADELIKRGAEYYHFPLDEEVDDIGWKNIVKAVEVLLRYDAQDRQMVVHCDYGQHRSRLVVEAFYYAKFGNHFIDSYKGYDNHLIYNCHTKHLPTLEKVEGVLSSLLDTCQLKKEKDMFSLKFNALPNTDAILYWHEARSKVYKTFAEQYDIQTTEVYFEFSAPEAGWADISVYCDGTKRHTFPISAAIDPFEDIKVWMEDIANDFKLSSDTYIDAEGRTIILHYEHLRLAEVGSGRKFVHEDSDKDEWQSYDAMSCPDLGLFYIYDSGSMNIPVVCCCETKQFLFALYHAMLEFTRNIRHDIGKEWYYLDRDSDGNPTENNLTLYNTIKSPMIEWGIYSDCAYRHRRPKFNKREPIQETIHMWPDWGAACFWDGNGFGCGDTQFLLYGCEPNEVKIDLTHIKGLREWYAEFDHQDPMKKRPDDKYYDWLAKGWEVAKRVRQMLPPYVDLYYMWKSYNGVKDKYGYNKELARIVPDIRDVDERSRNRMKYKLY